MQKEACGRGQGKVSRRSPSTGRELRSQRDVICCEMLALLGSRRLCEESEKTGGGGADEAELDGERASGAVAELLVARVGRAALAGGAGAGGRGRERARGGGTGRGDGAVGLGEGSGDSGSGRGGSGGNLSVGGKGRRLGDGALDGGLDSLGDRAGGDLSAGGSALGGGGGSGSLDGRGDGGGDLGVLGDGGCDSSRGLGGGG